MQPLDTKFIASVITGAIAGFLTLHLTYALLAWAIGAWLAIVIALLASFVASAVTSGYMQAKGYDLAVEGCARATSFFRSLRA
jgi:hypothetical protein